MDNVMAWARAVLMTTPTRWSSLTESLPRDLLERPAAPGEWSASACLLHLLDAEQDVFSVRLGAFLAGQDIAEYNPETQGNESAGRSPAQLAVEFARRRSESLTTLDQITVDDLVRTARHSELGSVTLGQMIHEWAAHDLMHTVQAERALMQSFIPGSGPWRSTFSDHDLSSPMA